MAKKSKGFRDLLNEQKALDTLEQRLQQSDMGSNFAGIQRNPKGEVKMSEVLETLVEPYLEVSDDYQERLILFQIATIAWNLTLLPESEQQSAMKALLKQAAKDIDPLAEKEMKNFVNELMARKLELFSDNQRYIVDFELKDTGNNFHLSVASTLASPFK